MQAVRTHFLLVEDNPAHAKLVLLEMNKHDSVSVDHVEDGEQALDYLFQRGAFADRPRPDIVLLDLRLPRVDGFEVLRAVKTHEMLRRVPVVVLSSSPSDEDCARAYALHANSYLHKPLDFAQFEQMIQDLRLYWCDWNARVPSAPTEAGVPVSPGVYAARASAG